MTRCSADSRTCSTGGSDHEKNPTHKPSGHGRGCHRCGNSGGQSAGQCAGELAFGCRIPESHADGGNLLEAGGEPDKGERQPSGRGTAKDEPAACRRIRPDSQTGASDRCRAGPRRSNRAAKIHWLCGTGACRSGAAGTAAGNAGCRQADAEFFRQSSAQWSSERGRDSAKTQRRILHRIRSQAGDL